TVGVFGTLRHQEDWHNIDSIFEPSAKRSRARWIGEDPPVSQTEVPDAGVGSAAVNSVAAPGPDLQIVAASFRACLSASRGSKKNQSHKCERKSIPHQASPQKREKARLQPILRTHTIQQVGRFRDGLGKMFRPGTE